MLRFLRTLFILALVVGLTFGQKFGALFGKIITVPRCIPPTVFCASSRVLSGVMFNPTFHFVENKSQLFAELKAKLTFRITVGLLYIRKIDTYLKHLFGFFRFERGFIVSIYRTYYIYFSREE